MNAIVIEHVPVADLPPAWRARLEQEPRPSAASPINPARKLSLHSRGQYPFRPHAMHPLIETHRLALRALALRRGLSNLRVFGSMARGDATERSDVDLLVELPDGVSGLALGGLAADAQDLLGRPVDVVTVDALAPRLRPAVLRQAVAL